MGFYYSTRTIMYDIDYQQNKSLCVNLLKHDPRMISNMKNISFELVKPLIDISLTYIHKISFREFADIEDVYKTIEHAYRKSKMYKKSIMNFILTNFSKEHEYYSNYYSIKNFDFKNTRFVKLIKEIIEENPMYIVFITDEKIKKLFSLIGLDYKEFVSKVNFKKLTREVEKLNEKTDKFNRIIDIISSKYVSQSWWGKDYLVSEKTKDEKIQSMLEDFPDNAELNSLLLLLKMS